MSEALLTAAIKTRITPSIKQDIDILADARHTKPAAIHRDAIRSYIGLHSKEIAKARKSLFLSPSGRLVTHKGVLPKKGKA